MTAEEEMLSSVPARIDRVCGLEARLLLCVLLLCMAASDEWLLCGVSGDGGGGSSVASAGMAGVAPLRRQRGWWGRLLCGVSGDGGGGSSNGDERRRRGLDRDFAVWGRREEGRAVYRGI
jgi:hypothetical protein